MDADVFYQMLATGDLVAVQELGVERLVEPLNHPFVSRVAPGPDVPSTGSAAPRRRRSVRRPPSSSASTGVQEAWRTTYYSKL